MTSNCLKISRLQRRRPVKGRARDSRLFLLNSYYSTAGPSYSAELPVSCKENKFTTLSTDDESSLLDQQYQIVGHRNLAYLRSVNDESLVSLESMSNNGSYVINMADHAASSFRKHRWSAAMLCPFRYSKIINSTNSFSTANISLHELRSRLIIPTVMITDVDRLHTDIIDFDNFDCSSFP
ncbi:hypothetical protein GJ496_007368 [Pomphorhynchus laevis]|nr:hypothetical protein GJ496_007368 [Pomphorhynchus laevis]